MASLKQIMNVDEDSLDTSESHERSQDTTLLSSRAPASTAPTTSYTSSVNQVFATSSPPTHSFYPSAAGPARTSYSFGLEIASTTSTGVANNSARRISNTSTESMDSSYYPQSHGHGYDGHPGSSSASMSRSQMQGHESETPKLTPITGRVSRARKGMPVHMCELCSPPKPFTRAEHLRRHQLSHAAPRLACAVPGCDKVFYRKDLLDRHQQRHEQESRNPSPGRQELAFHSGGNSHPYATSYPGDQTHGHPQSTSVSASNPLWSQDNTTGFAPSQSDIPRTAGSDVYHQHAQHTAYLPVSWPVTSGMAPQATEHFPLDPSANPRTEGWSQDPFAAASRPSHDHSTTNSRRYPAFPASSQPSSAVGPYDGSSGMDLPPYHPESSTHGPYDDLNHTTVGSLPQTLPLEQPSESLVTFSSSIPTGPVVANVVPETQSPLSMIMPPSLSDEARRTVPTYIEVFWDKVHPIHPIIHRPSFDEHDEQRPNDSTMEHKETRRFAMAAIATQYLGDKVHRIHGNELYAHAWERMAEQTQAGDWSLEIMQTILLCEYYARFRGKSRNTHLPSSHFRVLYQKVANVSNMAASAPSHGHTPTMWKEWVRLESQRRLLAACFLLDVHSTCYFKYTFTSALGFDYSSVSTLNIPLSTEMNGLWEAVDFKTWSYLARTGLTVKFLNSTLSRPLTAADIASVSSFDAAILLAGHALQLPTVCQNIAVLFRESEVANTYLALHHTPLHELLSVSGDSWLFNEKVSQARIFQEHKKRLVEWSRSREAAIAAFFAIRGMLSFLNINKSTVDEISKGIDAVRVQPRKDISDYWGLYVCVLICQAFGQGATTARASSSDNNASRKTSLEWLLAAAELDIGQLEEWPGRRRTRAIICLVRDVLSRDCPSGRNRMFNDAVNVLKNLGGRDGLGF